MAYLWYQGADPGALTKDGRLATSYDDRQYRDAETKGFSAVSLSGSGDLATVTVQRGTSAPMSPPTQVGGVFVGASMGLSAVDNAHRLWMGLCVDTRDVELCP